MIDADKPNVPAMTANAGSFEAVTEATQALLPVTQADREAAAAFARDIGTLTRGEQAAMLNGHSDSSFYVQALARHRQAHSLPGDVGTASASILEASWDIAFATFPESPDAFKAGVLSARIQGQFAALCDGMTRAEVHTHLDMVEAHDARAALTPSALSGDAGEGE